MPVDAPEATRDALLRGPLLSFCCDQCHKLKMEGKHKQMMYSLTPWDDKKDLAMNATQPFVLSTGDPLGVHSSLQDGVNDD